MNWKKVSGVLSPVVALFITSVTTSCSGDTLIPNNDSGKEESRTVTLTAKVDDISSQTRVGMNKETAGEVSFYWHKNDKILVQTKSGGTFSGTTFTINGDAAKDGDTDASFTGEVTGSVDQYAVYPYTDGHKHVFDASDATKLTYHLPDSYTYTTVESNIFSKNGTYPSNSTNMPMLGTIIDGMISFKHLGGLAVIRIDKMPAESGTLTVTADKQISGDFAVDLTADTPVIVTASTETDVDKQAAFTFSGATKNGVGVFYLPLATGTYSEMKLVISDGVNSWTVDYGTLSIARADVTAISILCTNGVYYTKNTDGNYRINGHTFVDLGLPSGLLWATTNVGATSATDCGKHYAWGEITACGEAKDWGDKSVKTDYQSRTYKYGTMYNNRIRMTKYNDYDGRTVLEDGDDAAVTTWGLPCRMPTNSEIIELINNCNWEWVTVDEVSGSKVSSKTNGNSIFLPATGFRQDTSYVYTWVDRYPMGYYWSRTLYPSDDLNRFSYFLEIESDRHRSSSTNRFRVYGMAVRPVAEKNSTMMNGQRMDDMTLYGFDNTWK